MAVMNEFQALSASLGESTVDLIGREHLAGLQVVIDPREHSAFMEISLRDNSDEVQRQVIRDMFSIEAMFEEELTVAYVFVNEIPESLAVPASAPSYIYA